MNYNTKLILHLVFLGTCLFLVGYLIGEIDFNDFKSKSKGMEIENYSLCNNSNLNNVSLCLKDYVSGFYNYNITNLDKDMNFTELKEKGGVCWHYANLYRDMLKEMGFNVETKRIGNSSRDGHMFTIAWSEDVRTYCILDQLNVKCVNLG